MSIDPIYLQAALASPSPAPSPSPTPVPMLTPLPSAFTPAVNRSFAPPPPILGNPPPRGRNIGMAPVAAQPHIEAPSYDSGLDPAWHGILDPNDHALRNALNEMSPETRQLLLMRLGRIVTPQTTSQAPGNI